MGHMTGFDRILIIIIVVVTIKKYAMCLKIISCFQANGLAAKGQYQAGSVQGQAADQGLFIKDHNY
jgi:hypothetical protein